METDFKSPPDKLNYITIIVLLLTVFLWKSQKTFQFE